MHRALLRELGLADDPLPEDLQQLAEHTSEREREAAQVEYAADAICLAWLLERRLYELGGTRRGTGRSSASSARGSSCGSARCSRASCPRAVCTASIFELNDLATAMAGRTTGRTYRLGDSISVRVERVARNEGKVELAPA